MIIANPLFDVALLNNAVLDTKEKFVKLFTHDSYIIQTIAKATKLTVNEVKEILG